MQTDDESHHLADHLIRDLIAHPCAATTEEIRRITDRIANAPFNKDIQRVPREMRGLTLRGTTLDIQAGSLTVHLFKRVLIERQWSRERPPLHSSNPYILWLSFPLPASSSFGNGRRETLPPSSRKPRQSLRAITWEATQRDISSSCTRRLVVLSSPDTNSVRSQRSTSQRKRYGSGNAALDDALRY